MRSKASSLWRDVLPCSGFPHYVTFSPQAWQPCSCAFTRAHYNNTMQHMRKRIYPASLW